MTQIQTGGGGGGGEGEKAFHSYLEEPLLIVNIYCKYIGKELFYDSENAFVVRGMYKCTLSQWCKR